MLLLLFVLILFVFYSLFEKSKKGFLLIASIVFLGHLMLGLSLSHRLFYWFKIFSVAAGLGIVLTIIFKQYTKAGPLIYGILVLNIIEAIVQDASKANYINMSSGILLIGLIPFKNNLYVNSNNMYFRTSHAWILAYTLWNLTFILGSFYEFFIVNIILLTFNFLVSFRNPHKWLQYRALSLFALLYMLETLRVFFGRPSISGLLNGDEAFLEQYVYHPFAIGTLVFIAYLFLQQVILRKQKQAIQ